MKKEDIKIGLQVKYDNEIVTIKDYFPQINNTSPSGDTSIKGEDGVTELVNHNELELIESKEGNIMDWELYSLDRRNINYSDLSEGTTLISTIKNQPKISDNLKIGDNVYHVGMIDMQKHHIGVHKINFIDENEVLDTLEDEFTCPYCGYIYNDAFELQDEGNINCPRCGSELAYERIVHVEYSVVPVKKAKVKEVK
jgi:DNA-directed RNA polymerase subunit RPC12/RpoP